MNDKDIAKLILANLQYAGRYIWMLNSDLPADRKGKFSLPPGARHEMEKMGLGAELRKLQRTITKGDRRTRTLLRRTRELSATFRSLCPRLDSKLLGSAVVGLLGSVDCAADLSERLRDITCIKGPGKRAQLRSILMEIQEFALAEQRRQVEVLRRDIPRLLKQLKVRDHRSGRRQ